MKAIRRRRGSTIAETGPALLILLLFTVFPAIMILGMGAQYAFAWYHNKLVTEELAARTAADGGGSNPPAGGQVPVSAGAFLASPVGQQIHNGFDSTGMAKFLQITSIKDGVVYYSRDPANPLKTDRLEVKTTLTGKPFISIPMFGFTSLSYNIGSEAAREVKR